MANYQKLFSIDKKGRTSLHADLRQGGVLKDFELLLANQTANTSIDISRIINNDDQQKLPETLQAADHIKAQILGIVKQASPIPVTTEKELVQNVVEDFIQPRFYFSLDDSGRFIIPRDLGGVPINRPGLLFQDLKTIELRGKVMKVILMAAVTQK